MLFHISSYALLSSLSLGEEFTLRPGTQNAEGVGVYFSEDMPRFSAAEGANRLGVSAIVALETPSANGWWRSKASICKKFGRPRTWHTAGKAIVCRIESITTMESVRVLHCSYGFK